MTNTDSTLVPIPFLPCVEANDAPAPAVLSAQPFAYIGQGLSLDAFRSYAQSYDYGPIPPDQVVIHNTANPDASWAPLNNDPRIKWDRDEGGLSIAQRYAKRRKQLDGVRDYYSSLGWTAGPHLFVDDLYIWLFTPMNTIGVHAKEGNSYHDAQGRLHYSLGVEVVGWYGKGGWPLSIQNLLRGAVQTLRDVLGTFQIVYKVAPPHQPARHQGSIAFHRDYNKPECPGAFITPAYAMPILAAEPTPPDPLRAKQLPGPVRPMYCGTGFYDFYYASGRGFPFFGYALTDEAHGVGEDGRACTWMRFERAIVKYVEGDGVKLALLSEATAQEWLPCDDD